MVPYRLTDLGATGTDGKIGRIDERTISRLGPKPSHRLRLLDGPLDFLK